MKIMTLLIFFLCGINITLSQDFEYKPVSNSFKEGYAKKRPDLKYSYEEGQQTHDYSNNWDFDGDKINDQLYFIGNGGAHLYYHLRVILSSNKKVYNLDFIQLDMPSLTNIDELKNEPLKDYITEFAIFDFDSNSVDDIYVNFDDTFSSIPCKWKLKGVSSRHLILNFNKGKLNIKNYIPKSRK